MVIQGQKVCFRLYQVFRVILFIIFQALKVSFWFVVFFLPLKRSFDKDLVEIPVVLVSRDLLVCKLFLLFCLATVWFNFLIGESGSTGVKGIKGLLGLGFPSIWCFYGLSF